MFHLTDPRPRPEVAYLAQWIVQHHPEQGPNKVTLRPVVQERPSDFLNFYVPMFKATYEAGLGDIVLSTRARAYHQAYWDLVEEEVGIFR